MKTQNTKKGFTLIETVIAIFILTLAMAPLLTLAASGYYSVRYSRNQIVADNLVQEAVEIIRNRRDTIFFEESTDPAIIAGRWAQMRSLFNSCFTSNGCAIDIYTTGPLVVSCTAQCPYLTYYENQGLYAYTISYPYTGGTTYPTSYVRTVKMTQTQTDQIRGTVTVSWLDGGRTRTSTQDFLLTNWKSFVTTV